MPNTPNTTNATNTAPVAAPPGSPTAGGPPSGQPVLPTGLLQLGGGYQASKTFLSATELGVFNVLADGPLDELALRERVGIHPRGARDFFDALVGLGLLDRDEQGYHNSPEAQTFLVESQPTYIGGFFRMTGVRLFSVWGQLTTALRTGLPQSEAEDGKEFFGALYADPERLRMFITAMDASAPIMGKALAANPIWGGYQNFVDVGGARGGVAAQIARAHPHLDAGCFDLPAVEPIFDEHMERLGLASRVRFHAGDFFADPLPETDVAVFGHVLHDWGQEEKQRLLEKAFEAVRPGGAVLVYDPMLDEGRRTNVFGLLSSLNMLLETHAGFEYTASQCQDWMRAVGFRDVSSAHLAGPDTVVVGRKPR
jgi:SAM-dependent methyltransferase